MKAYMMKFTRAVSHRMGVFGDTPEAALEEAQRIIASGLYATSEVYEGGDAFIVSESVAIADDGTGKPVPVDPHLDCVLFDSGSIETLTPDESDAPYLFEWRGDVWMTNGHIVKVAVGGPRIEADERWRTSIRAADMAQVDRWIERATELLSPWSTADTRWCRSRHMSQEYAVTTPRADGKVREPVVDARYVYGGRSLRWTCSLTPGEPVCGWDGDRLVIVVMPVRADRIVFVGAT